MEIKANAKMKFNAHAFLADYQFILQQWQGYLGKKIFERFLNEDLVLNNH